MSKQVQVIKANRADRSLSTTAETLRVAAYVRVSTDHKEQLEVLSHRLPISQIR